VTWALDLDGVVWLAGRAIPGSAGAVAELRQAGERVVFLTNNSGPTVSHHVAALGKIGIDCSSGDLITSAQAAASLLVPGSTAAVVGDAGVHEALEDRGVVVIGPGDGPDAVVVGRRVELDYWALAAAATAIRQGARFVATNTDATFPTGEAGPAQAGRRSVDGLLPGAGALVAFVATASGHQPEVAGKPHAAMAALAHARFGSLAMMVGDRADTDGLFAKLVEAPFGLVLSGVTRHSDLPVDPVPDLVGDDLGSLVRSYLAAAPSSERRPAGPRLAGT
jgi:HAD superfamily hydrolase (TIGR01450 family)